MAYKFDAFFSYKRDSESNDWHDKVRQKIAFWLKQELQEQEVRIFLDREDIRTGSRWRQQISDALKTSKCLICLWSPLYFQSKWCVSEWLSFAERGKQYGADLVLPASYFDGETFPPDACQIQWADFSRYTSTMPGFWSTELAVNFERDAIKQFATDLARMIRNAPEFSSDFPIVEASNEQIAGSQSIRRIADD